MQMCAGEVRAKAVDYLSGEQHAFQLCAALCASSASAFVRGARSTFHEPHPANMKA